MSLIVHWAPPLLFTRMMIGWELTSTNSGRRVILCMGRTKKDCRVKPCASWLLSSLFRASRNRLFLHLYQQRKWMNERKNERMKDWLMGGWMYTTSINEYTRRESPSRIVLVEQRWILIQNVSAIRVETFSGLPRISHFYFCTSKGNELTNERTTE